LRSRARRRYESRGPRRAPALARARGRRAPNRRLPTQSSRTWCPSFPRRTDRRGDRARSHRREPPAGCGFSAEHRGLAPMPQPLPERTLCSSVPAKGGRQMSATRPILFATDGSPSAADAQRKAIELAQALGAPLVVVSVAHAALPVVGYGGYGYSNIVAELTEEEHKR